MPLEGSIPRIGRMRDEILPGLRSVVIRPYVAFYRSEGDTILVLRILHGRRDIERIMGESG